MQQTEKIRVLIVDDHDLLRKGIGVALKTCADITIVGEASNGIEALEQCQTTAIDVILMDLIMPKMDGITAARSIHEKYSGIQILALTAFDEAPLIQSALDAGCVSHLIKNIALNELVTAIRVVYTTQKAAKENKSYQYE